MLKNIKNIFKKNKDIIEENKNPEELFKLFEKHKENRDFKQAIYYLELASKYEPGNLKYKLILSTLYLNNEDFEKGWEFYELRFKYASNIYIEQPIPRWNGITDKNNYKKIIVFIEQGFGDCFMFSRFLYLLKKNFSWVTLCTTKSLSTVLTKENLNIDEVIIDGEGDIFNYDCYCQLLSLPYLLGINTKEKINENFNYLNNKYKKNISLNDKIKVGICFHGRLTTDYEKSRAFDLNLISNIFKNDKYEFYSFYNPEINQDVYLKNVEDGAIKENKEMFEDFNKTASLIKNMDFMITTDTAVAHLSGSLGIKTYLLLPRLTDWRWQVHGDDSYWYPSFKLLRQKENNNWFNVAEEIKNIILENEFTK